MEVQLFSVTLLCDAVLNNIEEEVFKIFEIRLQLVTGYILTAGHVIYMYKWSQNTDL